MSKHRTSYAKAMGLKSILVSDSVTEMLSFAKGSDARLEKMVEDDRITDLIDKNEEAFSAEFVKNRNDNRYGYSIKNSKFSHPEKRSVIAADPLLKGSVKPDMLELKSTLEKRIFGTESNGNALIQIAYNIQDIEKILTEYITNAVYAVNNIAGMDKDIIGFGKFSPEHTYEEFSEPDNHKEHYNNDEYLINAVKNQYEEFDAFLDNPRFGYFGKAFFQKKQNRSTDFVIKYDIECYHILSLISGLRNWIVHNNEDKARVSRTWLYDLENNLDQEYIETLDYMYDDIANEIVNSSSTRNSANVNYISEILNISSDKLAEQYFRFSIMKDQKNLGFNITKLRETMLDRQEMSDIHENHNVFDTIRSKLYTMIDFVIYRYYMEEDKKTTTENNNLPDERKKLSKKDIFVINLRGCFNDEHKDKLYAAEAEQLWKVLGNIMKQIKKFRGDMTKSYQKKPVPKFPRILHEAKDISVFSKLIYALTMFLDGKEINDLLTTLINKFENIQCFLKIMPQIGVNANLVDEYTFFNNSEKIASELKLIKSLAKMGEPVANTKRAMMIDAIKIIGTELNDDELKTLADLFFFDENGKKKGRNQHGMRNFIINNVISNKRFHYLIRYGDPSHLHEIVKNEAVVKFVLTRIAKLQKKQGQQGKNQIDRYYECCIGKGDKKTVTEKIEALTDIITNMNYDQFEKNRDVIEHKGKNNAEKEKYKKILSLYLTVIYHILKNIVNINSRYVIGFHCVERDAQLYKEKGYSINIGKLDRSGYTSVTKLCLGIADDDPCTRKKAEKEMAQAAQDTLNRLSEKNTKLFKKYNSYSDTKKEKEFQKQIIREKAATALNNHLRDPSYNHMLREYLSQTDKTACKIFRNKAAHLEVARYAHQYINEITEVKSYFQLYHYIMQRIIMDNMYDEASGKTKAKENINDYFDDVRKNKDYNNQLLKLLCVPFGYCIPRFKNLANEALFDMNEDTKPTPNINPVQTS